jgi:hypothetical protein
MSSLIESVARSIPLQGIDFGYCAVGEETAKSFTMHNPSSSTIRFSLISGENLFTVSTTQGKPS